MMRTKLAKQGYGGFAHASTEKENSFDINHLHRLFGHCDMESQKNTVKLYGLKYLGDFETCEECSVAQA
jgi:hypothetical protein